MGVEILGGMLAPVLLDVQPVGRAHLSRCNVAEGVKLGGKKASPVKEGRAPVGPTRAISVEELETTNHYEILGLEAMGIGVDEDMVRRAYHKALLVYHPDKKGGEGAPPVVTEDEDDDDDDDDEDKKENGDAVFLAVQKAYQILSDQTSRRAFDSTNKFDGTIPKGTEAAEQGSAFDFYATYGPVFRSNARFTDGALPVPELGDEATPEEEVDAFYEYWFRFESWRDFSLEAREHDADAAEDRYEKRYMQKENEKLAKKAKKDEYTRLMNLVDRAKANDPRPKRFAKERSDAKKAAKEAKEAAIREAKEAEEAAKAEEAKVAAEKLAVEKAGAKDAKGVREKLKKAKRRAEKQIAACAALGRAASLEGVLEFTELELLYEDEVLLADVAARITNAEITVATKILRTVVTALGTEDPVERARLFGDLPAPPPASSEPAPPAPAPVEKKSEKKVIAWSSEEISMLAKAGKKFAPGARNRWESIADHLNLTLKLAIPKTKDDCIAKFNELNDSPATKKNGTNGASPAPAAPVDGWTEPQQKQLEEALQRHPAKLGKDERWRRISNDVDGKSKKDCAERFKKICENLKKDTPKKK